MRIALVGNQDNNAYRLGKWLRWAGADAELFLLAEEEGYLRSGPELVDPELGEQGYPPWVRRYDPAANRLLLARNPSAREIRRDFEVVVTSGVHGLLKGTHFPSLPVVHLALGWEVSVLPLLWSRWGIPLWERRQSLLARLLITRRHRFITSTFPHTHLTLKRLGVAHKGRIVAFPEDVEGNRRRVDGGELRSLNQRFQDCERVFLWFSRLDFLDRRAPSYKGPERFLEAFRRLVAEDRREVRAVIGAHGRDTAAFTDLVRDSGLSERVEFVPHLPFWRLLTYLSIANAVVVDVLDRDKGHLQGVAREALSVGTPVIRSLDQELVSLCFGPGCPVIPAHDASTCHLAMAGTLGWTAEELARRRDETYSWALRSLHFERLIERYLNLLGEAVYWHRLERSTDEPSAVERR